jgi:hypothetical protein
MRPAGRAGRVKQLLQHWSAGDLLGGDRAGWLKERDPERLFARLAAAAEAGAPEPAEAAG